jgi:hypothetical protein
MLDVFLRERNEQKVQFKHAAAAVPINAVQFRRGEFTLVSIISSSIMLAVLPSQAFSI